MQTLPVKQLATGMNVRLDEDVSDLLPLIQKYGIKNPLLVYEQDGRWVIKEGHRRFACALVIGMTEVPVSTVDAPADKAEAIQEQIVINNSQKPLSFMATARAYRTLRDECGKSQQKIGEMFGVSKSVVSLAMSTLDAHPRLQEAIDQGKLEPSAVEPLLPLPMSVQEDLVDAVIRGKTARRVTALVQA